MPAIFYPVAIFLGQIVASLVGRVLLALGLGFVIYTGLNIVIDLVRDTIIATFGGVPADMVAMIATLNIDRAITIILSAYAARVAIRAVMGFNRRLSSLPGGGA